MFLRADGFGKCLSCDKIVCIHCQENIDRKNHCLPCYAAEMLVPELDVSEGGIPISVMEDESAKEQDVERASEFTVEEVEGLYEQKAIDKAHLSKMAVDTDYNKRAGYLEEQDFFQNNDLIREDIISFTNMYGKECQAKMVAQCAGKHRVLQPVWAQSDNRFGMSGTLLMATVARDCRANERAVHVCKGSLVGVSKKMHAQNN